MAFTETEKAQIRSYLGYPAVNRSSDVTLEGALVVVGADAAATVLVQGLLAELAGVDTALTASRGALRVGEVDGAKLRGPEEIRALRAEGLRLTARLARVFDVRALGSAYDSGPMSGTVGRC